MKSCIVFAVSIFDKSRLYVLHEFLTTFKTYFSECDLYIGINYNSVTDVETIIDSYKLNVFSTRLTTSELYCNSDASAYQQALKLLKHSNNRYDLYWFAHTKGAVNDRPLERSMYLSKLFKNRTYIESMFADREYLGSYALRGVSRSAAHHDWAIYNQDHEIGICSNHIDNDMQYTHVNWSYIETMYVLNKKSVETFLNITTDIFYDRKINEPCYFEVIFPWIVSRCGYFPYVLETDCFFGERNLNEISKEWIRNNNLSHLTQYLIL